MKSCEIYIFSREESVKNVMDACRDCFEAEEQDGRLHMEDEKRSIDILFFGEAVGEQEKKVADTQRDNVCRYYMGIPDCDEDIRINLLHYLKLAKLFIPVKITYKADDNETVGSCLQELVGAALNVIKKMDGILVVNGGRTILDPEGRIILSEDGSSQVSWYFPFVLEENPAFLSGCSARQLARRTENMRTLFDDHIYVPELPVNEDDEAVTLRTEEEIAKRIFGLLAVSLYSEAILNPAENMSPKKARKFVKKVLKGYGIKEPSEMMTREEWGYFNDDQSAEKVQIRYSWCYEHLYALEWAAGLDEWTKPEAICDVPKSVRLLAEMGTYEAVLRAVRVRSKKEILDKADLLYRMDWACVDASLYGLPSPAGLNPGVVNARHKTLNWLICFMDADWDDVDTST